MNGEDVLRGGRTTSGVVRVGETVRRPVSDNSGRIAALLVHLARAGFNAAPRFLGFDEHGRISLSYIPGTVPPDLALHDDEILRAAATLIRRYHDATVGFFSGSEIACHNDLSPCNFVFADDRPAAIIDFDAVAPGSRTWDLGYAAWLWLDIGNDEIAPPEQVRRLEIFARAYDSQMSGSELITPTIERQRLLACERGDAARLKWASECLDWTTTNFTS